VVNYLESFSSRGVCVLYEVGIRMVNFHHQKWRVLLKSDVRYVSKTLSVFQCKHTGQRMPMQLCCCIGNQLCHRYSVVFHATVWRTSTWSTSQTRRTLAVGRESSDRCYVLRCDAVILRTMSCMWKCNACLTVAFRKLFCLSVSFIICVRVLF